MFEYETLHNKLRENLRDYACQDYLKYRQAFTREFITESNVAFISDKCNNISQEERSFLALSKAYTHHLLFPTFTSDGYFSGYIGRSIVKDDQAKYLLPDHPLFSKQTHILGLKDIFTNDYCFVTENIFEYIRIKECGFQALSLNGAYKSKYKVQILATLFSKGRIILVTDNDQAGQELRLFIQEFLDNENILNDYVHHREKGLDEFYKRYGKDETKNLLMSCLNNF